MPFSIQEDLRGLLGEDQAVTDLVEQRIFPGQVPDDEEPTPWLYYAVPDSTPLDRLDGTAAVLHQIEFHSWAGSYAEAKAIIEAVKDVLDGTVHGRRYFEAHWRGTAEEVTTDDEYHHVARFEVLAKVETGLVAAGAVYPTAGGSYLINP